MNSFVVSAVATAIMIGAGAGALTKVAAPEPEPCAEIMNPMIDGQAMLPTLDLADNVTASPEHTVLTVYLKETDLDALLKGHGPYTLFAPSDKAF
ncbi:MAG: fasciclin domain-containing protein, partial [Alphaproteobacteria bacterium]|nr:fasciclin domain-containing protein [Alphaproteobacteria bacterium]